MLSFNNVPSPSPSDPAALSASMLAYHLLLRQIQQLSELQLNLQLLLHTPMLIIPQFNSHVLVTPLQHAPLNVIARLAHHVVEVAV